MNAHRGSAAENAITDIVDAGEIIEAGAPPPGGPPDEPPRDPPSGPDDPVDWDAVRVCAAQPETDIGNGRRFLIRHQDDALFVQRVGWHVFDERRWREDVQDATIRPLSHRTAEAIALESAVVEPSPEEEEAIAAAEEVFSECRRLRKLGKKRSDDEELRLRELDDIMEVGKAAYESVRDRKARRMRYAKSSANKGKLDAMLNEAAPYVSIALSELDRDALAFNCETGTLRFTQTPDPDCPEPDVVRLEWTARVAAHRRADLISKLAPVDFDQAAAAPQFHAFIRTILPDPQVRAYLQRYFGYAMTARTSEQVFVICHGEGRNGKSTLVDIIARIMGDYATSVPIATLVNSDSNRRGAEATPDLARLPGARLVRAAEPKEGMSLDESLVKGLTSGEPLPVRRLNQDFIDIYPTFKLIISANRKPVIRGNDEGIWRRVSLVPFTEQIPKDEVDKGLPEKLWAERAGILNWMIEGLLDYLNRGGLEPPDAVRAATEEYRDESDVVGAFFRAAIEVTRRTEDTERPGSLYSAYQVYCRAQSLSPVAATTFNRRLPASAMQFGIERARSNGTIYIGLRIKEAFLAPEAAGHSASTSRSFLDER